MLLQFRDIGKLLQTLKNDLMIKRFFLYFSFLFVFSFQCTCFTLTQSLANSSKRAVSFRAERSMSRGFDDLDTVMEEKSDPEQTQVINKRWNLLVFLVFLVVFLFFLNNK